MTDNMEPTDWERDEEPADPPYPEEPVKEPEAPDPGTVDDMNRQVSAEPVKDTLETLFEGPPLVPRKLRARNCTRKCWVARGKKCACPCAGANHGKDRTIETFAEINARPPFVLPEHIEPGHEESLKEMFNKLDAEEKLPEPKIGLRGRLRRWRSLRRIARGP